MIRRGLTLLELLIVLAMIVVLAAVSLPAIRQAWQHQQLKQAADLLRAVVWTNARESHAYRTNSNAPS